MSFFFLGLAVLVGGLLFVNWFTTAKPKSILKGAKWTALAIAVGVVLLVLLTRNFHLIWAGLLALLPWISRFRMLRNIWKTMRGPSAGQRSEISCRFFDMHLDHDTGAMDGRIREGQFAGALLSELSMVEGRSLYEEIRTTGDAQSLRLLEAYLDRVHGADWRDGGQRQDAGDEQASDRADGPMTESEALSLLGLEAGATESEIKAAHRRLMKQVHPDAGGSAYLAAKINAAKDFLLKRR
ncbi:MAG: DnaJ domain-containing protein [Alphaproteobacteria bacterium]|nr:DnaJ domain-containing protein [Alphaproteobacteria bacterium]